MDPLSFRVASGSSSCQKSCDIAVCVDLVSWCIISRHWRKLWYKLQWQHKTFTDICYHTQNNCCLHLIMLLVWGSFIFITDARCIVIYSPRTVCLQCSNLNNPLVMTPGYFKITTQSKCSKILYDTVRIRCCLLVYNGILRSWNIYLSCIDHVYSHRPSGICASFSLPPNPVPVLLWIPNLPVFL